MLSILSLIRQGFYTEAIIATLARCFVVFCCLPLHELAHGMAAYKLGDNTAKLEGRLTLNPFKHLNPIGTLMIFLFGIGYAKPVSINANNFKNPKRDMALTALAGPGANIVLAFIALWLGYLFNTILGFTALRSVVILFFYFAASVNISLAVFNLLPIPPLDGSKVLAAVLPYKTYVKYMQYERYIMIGLIVLLFSGVLDGAIRILSKGLFSIIDILPSHIFGYSLADAI